MRNCHWTSQIRKSLLLMRPPLRHVWLKKLGVGGNLFVHKGGERRSLDRICSCACVPALVRARPQAHLECACNAPMYGYVEVMCVARLTRVRSGYFRPGNLETCEPCTKCKYGEYMDSDCTALEDRVCILCPTPPPQYSEYTGAYDKTFLRCGNA